MAKDIIGIVGAPLGKRDLPEPADLRGFWSSVERALTGLNKTMELKNINNKGCHNLAPVILGEACYEAIRLENFWTWDDFKTVVNMRFGLSEDQLSAQFYAIRLKAGEAGHDFMCRMEDKRL